VVTGILAEAAEQVAILDASRSVDQTCAADLAVQGDRDQLARMLRNLVENAVKYSPAGSRIALTARRTDRDVSIEVGDQGVGIDAADLPHIFEPFFRADRSRTRRTGGSGLGLAIVRAIVQGHGGRIAVESAPGRGTTVQVCLPSGDL